jgi:hypothetical protein
MLCLLEGMPSFRNLESGIRNLKRESESISKQLGAWIRSLRDSEKKGQRYVTDKVRRTDRTARDRADFLEELGRIRAGG